MRMVVQQPSQRDEHVTGKCKTRTREWKNAEKKNVSCAQNCGLLSAVYTTHLLTTWTSSLVRSTKPIRPTSLNLYQNHIKMFLILRACVCVWAQLQLSIAEIVLSDRICGVDLNWKELNEWKWVRLFIIQIYFDLHQKSFFFAPNTVFL